MVLVVLNVVEWAFDLCVLILWFFVCFELFIDVFFPDTVVGTGSPVNALLQIVLGYLVSGVWFACFGFVGFFGLWVGARLGSLWVLVVIGMSGGFWCVGSSFWVWRVIVSGGLYVGLGFGQIVVLWWLLLAVGGGWGD